MPTTDELIFAMKTFAGGMAAFYFSCKLGLDNPYWSLATAYIVAQPFAGAVRSKALYRVFGTITGGTAAVALVPNLVNAPVLLSAAMAVWTGLCLYISLLDRTPRSYAFMLSGYTAAIIGFPSVAAPAHVFETALARMEEISLGIVCTTVSNMIIFPRALLPVLSRRIASWVQPGIDWAEAALAGKEASPEARQARRHLAAEAADTSMLISHLAYDILNARIAVEQIARLRVYLISIIPILNSVGARVAELERLGGITPALKSVLAAISAWVKSGKAEGADALLEDIRGLESEPVQNWPSLLRTSLALRLEELVRLTHQSRKLRQYVLEGREEPASLVQLNAEYVAAARQHQDQRLAVLSGIGAALAVLLVCAIWIQTAWSAGAGAAVLAAVACSMSAAQDDPARALTSLMRNILIVLTGIFLLNFGVLPAITGFDALCLVLLPLGLVIGVMVSRPATFNTGMRFGAFGSTQLALENGYHANFLTFANNSFALIIGISSAFIVTRLIRSVGAAMGADRLMRANWLDIAAAAEARTAYDRAALTGIMMDRLGLMVPRLASVAAGADDAVSIVLRDLRIGFNIITLHHEFWRLPPVMRDHIQRIFSILAAHYRADPRDPPPQALLLMLDEALAALMHDAKTYREALLALSGLRTPLFPDAPPPDLGGGTAERSLMQPVPS